jgi:hypothetical protein
MDSLGKKRDAAASSRKSYLGLLEKHPHIIVLGGRNSGKTWLAKHYLSTVKDAHGIYVDLRTLSISPENFSVEFSLECLAQYFEITPVPTAFTAILETIKPFPEIQSVVHQISAELEKIKPDQRSLVRLALSLPSVLHTHRPVVLCVDEFQEIIGLDNYGPIGDVLSLFSECISDVPCKLFSSAVSLFKEKALTHFTLTELMPLSRDETMTLVKQLVASADGASCDTVYKLTHGHPYYILRTCERMKETEDARKAFLVETLWSNGGIYTSLESQFGSWISRTKGQTLLKTIIKILAIGGDLRLSELARKIYHSAPVTKALLERLMAQDVVSKRDSTFSLTDPVFRFFLTHYLQGQQFEEYPDDEMFDSVEGQP